MQDAELAAQMLALMAGSPAISAEDQIAAGVSNGLISAPDAGAICRSLSVFWQLQASARLLTGGTLVPEELGEGGRRMVLRETGETDMASLANTMAETAAAADAAITRLLIGSKP